MEVLWRKKEVLSLKKEIAASLRQKNRGAIVGSHEKCVQILMVLSARKIPPPPNKKKNNINACLLLCNFYFKKKIKMHSSCIRPCPNLFRVIIARLSKFLVKCPFVIFRVSGAVRNLKHPWLSVSPPSRFKKESGVEECQVAGNFLLPCVKQLDP